MIMKNGIKTIVFLLTVILLFSLYYKQYIERQEMLISEKNMVWLFDADDRLISCISNSENNSLFLNSSNYIYLLDAEKGNLIWKKSIDAQTDVYRKYSFRIGVKRAQRELLIPMDDGGVLSVSLVTGDTLWKDKSNIDAPILDIAVDQGFAYVARLSSSLVAIDLTTGKRVWENSVPDRTSLYIAVYDDKVYLATSYTLFVYDAQSGDLLMEYQLEGMLEKILIDANSIYITYLEGEYVLVSLDRETLNRRWAIDQNQLSITKVSSLIINDDILYITGDRLVSVSIYNGDVVWISRKIDSFGTPVILRNMALVLGNDHIYKIDIHNGQLLETTPTPVLFPLLDSIAYLQANPCQTNNMHWLLFENKVYAYKD